MSVETAHVEVLTAEVRTLMVGSRQVTMSVAKQLDICHWSQIEPFGRVCMSPYVGYTHSTIGRHPQTGALVLAVLDSLQGYSRDDPRRARLEELWALPLIVLAGLR